jgi:hypothetical protein
VDGLGDGLGFVIEGEEKRDYASQSAGVGDVNGDGLDDIAVGAPGACSADGCNGIVYIVFGKKSGAPVALSDIGEAAGETLGYPIEGARGSVGWDVASAGDLNGDGLADILISSPFGGAFYVVHGQSSTATVDLGTFDDETQGMMGYRVDAPSADRNDYYSAANAGDVNGDGLPDAVFGVIRNQDALGAAYVVFGKLDPAPIDVSNLLGRGYAMRGPLKRSSAGYAVAGAGDVNGDGLADTLVTAPAVNCCSDGDAYIVFGKPDPMEVDLKSLGSGGIHIKGYLSGANIGESAAMIGDSNGDGLQDFALGAPRAGLNNRPESGSVFVVYGRDHSGTIRLSKPGFGFRIDGRRGVHCRRTFNNCIGDFTGASVAAAGDVNDDGRADVALSAAYSGKGPHGSRGRSFLVLGR